MTFIRLIVLNKRKLFLNNLNIEITNEGKRVLKLEDLKYANFGYNKNLILGKIFEKNFKVNLDKQFESIVFSIQNSGINVDINFNDNKKNNKISGTFKSKIINTNIKLNFDYDDNILKITNFNLRNKNISFKNESFVVFKPFSQINSRFDIQEFDKKIFKIINLNDLLSEKNILKKISIKSEIYFTPKKFYQIPFNDLTLDVNLAYGTINYFKKIEIPEGLIQCRGDLNFLEDYPTLIFDCFLISNNKGKLFKEFSIKTKSKNKNIKLNFSGNFSLTNQKDKL